MWCKIASSSTQILTLSTGFAVNILSRGTLKDTTFLFMDLKLLSFMHTVLASLSPTTLHILQKFILRFQLSLT